MVQIIRIRLRISRVGDPHMNPHLTDEALDRGPGNLLLFLLVDQREHIIK